MLIIGLTGAIASGKSTTAAILAERGVAVFSADEAVHRLYEGKATPLVEAAFPGTSRDGAVDRKALSTALGDDPEARLVVEQAADRGRPRGRATGGGPHLDDRDFEAADAGEQIDGAAAVGELLEVPGRLEKPLDSQPHDRMRVDDHATAVCPQRFLHCPPRGGQRPA